MLFGVHLCNVLSVERLNEVEIAADRGSGVAMSILLSLDL